MWKRRSFLTSSAAFVGAGLLASHDGQADKIHPHGVLSARLLLNKAFTKAVAGSYQPAVVQDRLHQSVLREAPAEIVHKGLGTRDIPRPNQGEASSFLGVLIQTRLTPAKHQRECSVPRLAVLSGRTH
jgi:hypothetical protein